MGQTIISNQPQEGHVRLTKSQIERIRKAVGDVIGDDSARIWLFGSRVDKSLRGGDIDLFIETERELPNRAEATCRIYAKLILALGDRKIDVILKDGTTTEAPIHEVARKTGVLL